MMLDSGEKREHETTYNIPLSLRRLCQAQLKPVFTTLIQKDQTNETKKSPFFGPKLIKLLEGKAKILDHININQTK